MMPRSPERAEGLQVVTRVGAIIWVQVSLARPSRFWQKMHDAWSQWPGTLYPHVDRGWAGHGVLYVFASLWSTWLYGGESIDPARRSAEYTSRIAQGSSCRCPQPFFALFHHGCRSLAEIAWRLSHWVLVPLVDAGFDKALRLQREQHMIRTLQMQLNPPLVYGLWQKFCGWAPWADSICTAMRHAPVTVRCRRGPSRPGRRRRRPVYSPRASVQACLHHPVPAHLGAARPALAAAGYLPDAEAAVAIRELWRADACTLTQVFSYLVRKSERHHRARGLQLFRKIIRSRTGRWQLPWVAIRIALPWLGAGPPKQAAVAATRSFLRALRQAYSGVSPLFDARKFKVVLRHVRFECS